MSGKATNGLRRRLWAGSLAALGLCAALAGGAASTVAFARTQDQQEAKRPNILLIVADDLALGDLSLAGSEIATPNIDRLAAKGLRFAQFYTAPTCAPTRAMLLTGADANDVGLGLQGEVNYDLPQDVSGNPRYLGHLNDRARTVASDLTAGGYFTFMAGKWHLGDAPGEDPSQRGFAESVMMPYGGASHFDARGYTPQHPVTVLRENGKPMAFPNHFYSTDFYADRIIRYLDRAKADGRPFFGYAAFTAPHWPLQAPKRLIDRYVPKYRAGWDAVRARRFDAQQRLGLIPGDIQMPPRWQGVPEWASLTPDEQARQARIMATYAAMIDRLDSAIGRILAALDRNGQSQNTIIVFMSDNGAAAENFAELPQDNPLRRYLDSHYPRHDTPDIGGPDAWAALGRPWAQVSSVAFRLHKATVFEGGVRSPLIISDPRDHAADGTVATFDWHVTGIAPTFLEWAGLALSRNSPANDTLPPTGVALSLARKVGEAKPIIFASLGAGFVIDRNWKLVRETPPAGRGNWLLYDLDRDPGETNDLSGVHPERVRAMRAQFEEYEATHQLIRIPPCWNTLVRVIGGPSNEECARTVRSKGTGQL